LVRLFCGGVLLCARFEKERGKRKRKEGKKLEKNEKNSENKK